MSLDLLALVTWMLFTLGMKAKEMDEKFQEGVDLWNQGKSQECANIWMDLADFGHLDSIEQLVYIFLDQKEFEEVTRLIDCAKNPNEPLILYLKARLIQERDGVDAAMNSFKTAAEAGNPNSYLFLLEVAIEIQSIEDAKFCLSKLAEHSEFFETPSGPANYYKELKERVEELIAKLEAAEESEFHDDNDDDDDDSELNGLPREVWEEVIHAFISGDDDERQEIQDTYPQTFETFVNLKEYGLFEIWSEWSANLELGQDEAQYDFLTTRQYWHQYRDAEGEMDDEEETDNDWQRLSVQEEYLPSSDDDRYVFNIEGGVCAITAKTPKMGLSKNNDEINDESFGNTTGIDCQLHSDSKDCYINKCEASLITVPSGFGDGVYRVAAFNNSSGDIECVLAYFFHPFAWDYVESKLIFGERTIGSIIRDDKLVGNLEDHIPIYLGEIKSAGSLNFGDRWAWSEAGCGDDYRIASIAVPADEYLVLGWIEALSFDPESMKVFIVGLYRGEMKEYYSNLMEQFPVIKTFADEHLDVNRNLGDY